MINLDKPIVLSSTRAIVGFDPDGRMAIIDSKGLRMSSMRYIGQFDVPDSEFDKIQQFEKSMKGQFKEAYCKTGKGGGVDNSCSSRRKKNASQQNIQPTAVSIPTEEPKKKKKDESSSELVARLNLDVGVLFDMSWSDLESHERAIRFNRIRMSQEDYVTLLDSYMMVKATRWKGSPEHEEFQRKLKFIADGGVDPVTGFEGDIEYDRLLKEMNKAKDAHEFWLKADTAERTKLIQGLKNEHAKGVKNAIKDNRLVSDEAVRSYLTEKWMPDSIKQRFGKGFESKIEGLKSTAFEQAIRKYVSQNEIDDERKRMVSRNSRFSAVRENIKTALDSLEAKKEAMAKRRMSLSFRVVELSEQIADAQKALMSKTLSKDDEQKWKTIRDGATREAEEVKNQQKQLVQEEYDFDYRGKIAEVVKSNLGVQNGIEIKTTLAVPKSMGLPDTVQKVNKKIEQAKAFLGSVVADRKSLRNRDLTVELRHDVERAFYDPTNEKIVISPTSSVATIAHEIAHHLEVKSSWPGTDVPTARRAKALVAAEAGRNPEVNPTFATWDEIKSAVEKNPAATPDKWHQLEVYVGLKGMHDQKRAEYNYARKLYPQAESTEVITMGISRLIESPKRFIDEDPSHFNFVLEWLQGAAAGQMKGSGD